MAITCQLVQKAQIKAMGLHSNELQPRIHVQNLFSRAPDVPDTLFKPLCLCAVPNSLELSEVR
jgi:hypothetical protein